MFYSAGGKVLRSPWGGGGGSPYIYPTTYFTSRIPILSTNYQTHERGGEQGGIGKDDVYDTIFFYTALGQGEMSYRNILYYIYILYWSLAGREETN